MHKEFIHIGTVEDQAIEEAAELILAIQKAKRFGWYSRYKEEDLLNYQQVLNELNDCKVKFERLQQYLLTTIQGSGLEYTTNTGTAVDPNQKELATETILKIEGSLYE